MRAHLSTRLKKEHLRYIVHGLFINIVGAFVARTSRAQVLGFHAPTLGMHINVHQPSSSFSGGHQALASGDVSLADGCDILAKKKNP